MDIKRMRRNETVFVAVDFQEKLLPAMFEREKVEGTACKLAEGLKVLGIPKIVTQQYTKGLGNTVKPMAEALGDYKPIEKNDFSAWLSPEFRDALEKNERKTVILAGVEAHICVEQTALDLMANGYTVFVAADCVQSRSPVSRDISLRRMEASGAVITCSESILYELLQSSKAPEFKAISAIVK